MIDTQNTVIKQVSRKTNISEETIKKVYEYYWKEGFKPAMRSGLHLSIRVAKFGTFTVSKWKLNNVIDKYIAYIEHLGKRDDSTFKKQSKEETILRYRKDLTKLLKLKVELDDLYKENKKNNETYKLLKADMG